MTASTGNHGAAVAWAASRLAMVAHVVVPVDASTTKCSNVAAHGGRLHRRGASLGESSAHAAEIAAETGLPLLVDGTSVAQLQGTGTIAEELIAEGLDTVVVPLACGALAGGIARVLKRSRPAPRVIGVQSASFARLSAVFHGRFDPGPGKGCTFADGLADDRLVEPALSDCLTYLNDVLIVSDEEIAIALGELHRCTGILVEGAAAASLAALRRGQAATAGRRVAAIITGGNIDPGLASRILRHEVTSGRDGGTRQSRLSGPTR